MRYPILFLSSLIACCGAWAFAADVPESVQPKPEVTANHEPVDFASEIRPLLARKCFACHGPDEAEAGLNLTEQASSMAELDSGYHALIPGNPAESELLVRVKETDHDIRMPPEGDALKPEEIELLERWIAQGANWAEHWAWSAPEPQQPPQVANADWSQNPVDQFLLSSLESNGLKPNGKASARDLARRVHYNVTGLPPSEEFIKRIENLKTQQQWEAIVDELLERKEFGEHFARRWLDVVRFAETNSFERDGLKPNAWRYRDYVIRAFNDDKPYDRFLLEQLAGDELPDRNADSIIAAGFYRLGVWDDEPADQVQARYDELDDLITTTSQGMLGLTINCARCHEHKIDPIPQEDYYKFLAFFEGLSPYGSRGDQDSYNQWDISGEGVQQAHADRERLIREIEAERKELRELVVPRMPKELLEGVNGEKRRHEIIQRHMKTYATEAEFKVYRGLFQRLKKAREQQLPEQAHALSVVRYNPNPPETHVMMRGNPRVPGDVVEPGFPDLFKQENPVIPKAAEGQRTDGRRTVLGKWMTSDENYMTARVIVNRIWQHHFGRGIVRSANNFGELGTPPTHPELLDWLALKLIENKWSLKSIHRLVMNTQAYRMSSAMTQTSYDKDPNNDLFWRFNMRRLSAEEVRDSMLQVTGQLNSQMYGPGVYPVIPKEVMAGQSKPGNGWGKSSLDQQHRRSIYIHVKRSLITPMLSAFDFPEPDVTCEGRFVTTQPGQALQLLNSDEVQQYAEALLKQIVSSAGDQEKQRIKAGYQLVLKRQPTDQEIEDNLQFIQQAAETYKLSHEKSWELFALAMLNLNEFMYLD